MENIYVGSVLNILGSNYNGYVFASVNEITEVLGEKPYYYGPGQKSKYGWGITVYTDETRKKKLTEMRIYDWKEGPYKKNERIVFHIGSDNKSQNKINVQILQKLGLKAFIGNSITSAKNKEYFDYMNKYSDKYDPDFDPTTVKFDLDKYNN